MQKGGFTANTQQKQKGMGSWAHSLFYSATPDEKSDFRGT